MQGSLQQLPTLPTVTWDRCMLMATPSTPSSRFASDVMAGVRALAWVEDVTGRKLEGGSFGDALKDGIALCCLINKIRPATIAKVETSKVPFKQMANISAFIQACKTLGVRESSLFETLVRVLWCVRIDFFDLYSGGAGQRKIFPLCFLSPKITWFLFEICDAQIACKFSWWTQTNRFAASSDHYRLPSPLYLPRYSGQHGTLGGIGV